MTLPIRFPQRLTARDLSALGLLTLLAGMLLSNTVMSMGTGLLVLAAIIHPERAAILRRFLRDPVALSITLIFWLYLLGGIHSLDSTAWADKLRVKLPFLLLPWAFLAVPLLDHQRLRRILSVVVVFAVISVVVVSGLFAARYGTYTAEYTQGSVMPTPVNHIRYSLLLAMAAVCSVWLAASAEGGRMRWCWGLVAAGIAIFLHVLAVRSGLLALYVCAIYGLLRLVFLGRRPMLGLGGLGGGLLLVVLAFQFVPTLHNRLAYVRYDLERFAMGVVNPDLSDAKRIGSILVGWEVAQENPWTGVGVGDVPAAVHRVYRQRFPDLASSNPLPHNQFVFVAAALGFGGLLVFCWALLAPWLAPGAAADPLFVCSQLVLLPSMLTEATLETQYGVALYLFFTLLLLRRWR